jgi:hypothetical protein
VLQPQAVAALQGPAFEIRESHEPAIRPQRLSLLSGQTRDANARGLSPVHDMPSGDLDASN